MRFLLVCFGYFLVVQTLFAYDFSICQRYYKDASSPLENSRVIHIEHGDRKFFVGFFESPPKNAKIIKADPFIGLYAFDLSANKKQTYILMPVDAKALSLNLAGIALDKAQKGIILEDQKGFLNYARFSGTFPANGVVSNICYQIYGLGIGQDRFIDSKYLNRFLEQDFPYYGDIGVRLYPHNAKSTKLIVQYVDPFFPNVPFLKDDEILTINNHRLKNYYDFEWIVSNLKENSRVEIKIKRKDKLLSFMVEVNRRYGGFLLQDTFFDRIGITLDEHLKISAADPKMHKVQQGLREGDTILWINGQKIFNQARNTPQETQARIRELLTQAVGLGKLDILISRDGFQFTLNLINEIKNEYIKARYNPFGF